MEEFKYGPKTGEKTKESVDVATDEVEAAMEAAARLAEFGPLPDGNEPAAPQTDRQNLDLLLDVGLPISVEVGRTQMTVDAILDLVPGSVITLDKKAEDPVDLRVNGKLVAHGEVVLVDDVYGIRITQIVAGGVTAPAAE